MRMRLKVKSFGLSIYQIDRTVLDYQKMHGLYMEADKVYSMFSGAEQEVARKWLISHLKCSDIEITFTKKDGTERLMKCTLKEDVVVPYEKKTDKVKEKNSDTLSVWDVEKNAWRSFRWDSIKNVVLKI